MLAADDGVDAVRRHGARLHEIEGVGERMHRHERELIPEDALDRCATGMTVRDEHPAPRRFLRRG